MDGRSLFLDANFDVHDDGFLHDDTVVMCVMMSLAKTGNKIEPPFSNAGSHGGHPPRHYAHDKK